MITSTRREKTRFRPGLDPLEERRTPTVSSASFFGITPAPNLGTGSAVFNGLVVDSQSSPVANAHLAAYYQVLDLQGNLLTGGPLALSAAGGSSNSASFSQTIPAGSFTPSSQGEYVRIVAIDDQSVLIAVSILGPSQNVVFGEADSHGNTIVGNGTANVNESTLSDGGQAISGSGTIAAVGRNRNGTTLFTSSGNGLFAIADHPNGAFGLALNGNAVANAGSGSTTVNTGVSGQVTVVIDPNNQVSVHAAGVVKVTVHTPVGTFTGNSQNASVSVVVDSSGHVKLSVSGKFRWGIG